MDFGETLQQRNKYRSTLAGTERYMSFKLRKAYDASKNLPMNEPLIVNHDLEKSEEMSLGRTIISL